MTGQSETYCQICWSVNRNHNKKNIYQLFHIIETWHKICKGKAVLSTWSLGLSSKKTRHEIGLKNNKKHNVSYFSSKLGFCGRQFNHFQNANQTRVNSLHNRWLTGVKMTLDGLRRHNILCSSSEQNHSLLLTLIATTVIINLLCE